MYTSPEQLMQQQKLSIQKLKTINHNQLILLKTTNSTL